MWAIIGKQKWRHKMIQNGDAFCRIVASDRTAEGQDHGVGGAFVHNLGGDPSTTEEYRPTVVVARKASVW